MTTKPRPTLQPGETRAYPVLPLRDIVVFPHMIVPLFVGREKSIKALEEVMRSDTFILLATQKNASDDDPATDSIFEVGTLASVLQLLKLPDGTVKVLVEGATRARVRKYTDRVDYYEADATALADDMGDRVDPQARLQAGRYGEVETVHVSRHACEHRREFRGQQVEPHAMGLAQVDHHIVAVGERVLHVADGVGQFSRRVDGRDGVGCVVHRLPQGCG